MKEATTSATVVPVAIVEGAWQEVGASFERFCLTAGIATLANMMEEDAARLCGPRYGRAEGKAGHRWGKAKGKVGFHGGKVEIERPRVRARDGGEVSLPSWETAISEDLLGKWALNLMLINVSTRRFGRAVRLPEGDIPAAKGTGVSKSAVSRRFVALSAERMAEWMTADLSELDLLIIQIDGIHIEEDLILLAGIDGEGGKHPLGVIEGASENTAVAQALLDNLIGRGLGLPPVHHRRSQGAVQGNPQDLRPPYADPALPGSQSPQHHRAHRQALACQRAQGAASGVGTR
jgi:putative transposase